MSILEKFGNPFQAKTVPEMVERIAKGQEAIVRTILKEVYRVGRCDSRFSYFRKPDEVDKAGLPTYCFIVESTITTDMLDAGMFQKVLKDRYGERLQFGPMDKGVGVSYISWGMWLDGPLMEQFEAHELPVFEKHDFDTYLSFHIRTKEPVMLFDLDTFREKAEACGAALAVSSHPTLKNAIVALVPANNLPENAAEADRERVEWILGYLEPWGATDCGVHRLEKDTLDKVLENIEKASPVKEPAFVLEKADPTFLTIKVSHATFGRVYKEFSVKPTFETCRALLGEPHGGGFPTEGSDDLYWQYAFKIRDALAVVEVVGDNVAKVFMIPGKERVARDFELFLNVLRG